MDLHSLKLCVEKSLTEEEKALSIEAFNFPGTYSSGIFTPIKGISYTGGQFKCNRGSRKCSTNPLTTIEKYKNEKSEIPPMLKRIFFFLEKGILALQDPEAPLADSIMNKQFFIDKITITFGPENKVKRTPIIQLEGTRDNEGNIIKPDPLEYEIQKLSPINAVKKVLQERIFPLVNIEFEFIDEKDDELFPRNGVVRVGFEPDQGCWSLIGLDNFFSKDQLTMNFAWLDCGTIMHEFMHMLGLVHEHQLPLGESINWDEEAVYEWAETVHQWDKKSTYENIIKKYSADQLNGIDFDPKSIMLYFFPPQLTLDKKGTRQNLRLAPNDAKFLMETFPGKDTTYKQFYKQIYNVDIEDETQEEATSKLIPIIATLAFIGVLVFIYLKVKKKI